ncbi:MAG: hypothetical protein RLY86_3238 [Pseudomonadota bacterium]|jgi:hypothetical protein
MALSRRPAALLLTVCALLPVLTACSPRPTSVAMLSRPQPVLQSVQHWQIVAKDVASAISAHLVVKTGRKEPVALYMEGGSGSLFADAFLGAVTTHMVQAGHPVAAEPGMDVTLVGIDALIVPTRGGGWNPSTPGVLTALGAGAWVVRSVWDRFPWGATATMAGFALDTALAKPGETDTELVLTVSIRRDGFYAYRSSAVYYVNRRDLGNYQDGEGALQRNLNDLPTTRIRYDIAGKPYVAGP